MQQPRDAEWTHQGREGSAEVVLDRDAGRGLVTADWFGLLPAASRLDGLPSSLNRQTRRPDATIVFRESTGSRIIATFTLFSSSQLLGHQQLPVGGFEYAHSFPSVFPLRAVPRAIDSSTRTSISRLRATVSVEISGCDLDFSGAHLRSSVLDQSFSRSRRDRRTRSFSEPCPGLPANSQSGEPGFPKSTIASQVLTQRDPTSSS